MLNYYYKPKSILSFDREISIRYKQRCGLESNYNINSLIINPYTHKPLPLPYIPTLFVNHTKILFHSRHKTSFIWNHCQLIENGWECIVEKENGEPYGMKFLSEHTKGST